MVLNVDLRSGYHNIPIGEEDRDKTAYITRRYKVMPFGLTCAPSVFQRLVDPVLRGLTYVTCLVYLSLCIVGISRVMSNVFERSLTVSKLETPHQEVLHLSTTSQFSWSCADKGWDRCTAAEG